MAHPVEEFHAALYAPQDGHVSVKDLKTGTEEEKRINLNSAQRIVQILFVGLGIEEYFDWADNVELARSRMLQRLRQIHVPFFGMPSVQTWIEIAASKTLVQCSDLVNVSRHVFPWFGSAASQRTEDYLQLRIWRGDMKEEYVSLWMETLRPDVKLEPADSLCCRAFQAFSQGTVQVVRKEMLLIRAMLRDDIAATEAILRKGMRLAFQTLVLKDMDLAARTKFQILACETPPLGPLDVATLGPYGKLMSKMMEETRMINHFFPTDLCFLVLSFMEFYRIECYG